MQVRNARSVLENIVWKWQARSWLAFRDGFIMLVANSLETLSTKKLVAVRSNCLEGEVSRANIVVGLSPVKKGETIDFQRNKK